MDLKQITISSTEITLKNGTSVLFSYRTPVAAVVPGRGWLKTKQFYSTTTSKHINRWLADNRVADIVTTVPQSELDQLVAF